MTYQETLNIKSKYKSINYKKHLLLWALITAYLCVLDPVPGGLSVQLPVTALIIFNYIFVFYSIGLFIAPAIYRRKYFTGAFVLVAVYLIFSLVDLVNFNYVMPSFGLSVPSFSYGQILLQASGPFLLVSIPAIAYFFNDLSLEKMELQNIREKSLLLKELNFLKNQFNSHITFNFLNYCYSKVHQLSGDTAEAIDLFSNMLRYSLTIKPETKVPIQKEIQYIEDFIQLQKLLSTDVNVQFRYDGEFSGKFILPSILITFVENAFTHGEFTRPSNPIVITLQANHATILLTVSNKKRTRRNASSTGVGLENVRQLLHLYYPENHNLQVENSADDYTTRLQLSLN